MEIIRSREQHDRKTGVQIPDGDALNILAGRKLTIHPVDDGRHPEVVKDPAYLSRGQAFRGHRRQEILVCACSPREVRQVIPRPAKAEMEIQSDHPDRRMGAGPILRILRNEWETANPPPVAERSRSSGGQTRDAGCKLSRWGQEGPAHWPADDRPKNRKAEVRGRFSVISIAPKVQTLAAIGDGAERLRVEVRELISVVGVDVFAFSHGNRCWVLPDGLQHQVVECLRRAHTSVPGEQLPPSWAGQRKPLGTVRRESPVLRQTPAGRLGVSSFKLISWFAWHHDQRGSTQPTVSTEPDASNPPGPLSLRIERPSRCRRIRA